ncbi:MAG: GNAT family N-acetyltransferase [Clostridia bacterium]|nr:GNAT family N-acetyltransferase [Clostridia bacterium]
MSIKINAYSHLSKKLISRIESLNSLMPEYELYYESSSINGEKAFYTAVATTEDSASFKCTSFNRASSDNKLIGFLSFLWVPGSEEAELTAFVHPAYRNSGVFTQMLKSSRSECEKLGITRLYYCLPSQSEAKNKSHLYSHSEYLMKLDNSLMKTDTATLQKQLEALNAGYRHCQKPYNTCELIELSSGKSVCRCNLEDEESFTNMWGVMTDESHRRTGLATLLIRCVANALSSLSKPLVLQVSGRNTAALSLYEKCGFMTISRIDYYLIRNE